MQDFRPVSSCSGSRSSLARGVLDREVRKTSIAVIDLETTGLTPGTDRVVEVSVVRLEPDKRPQVVLDTLVNPGRPMAATEVHGITDDDVADAPEFRDVAAGFIDAVAGCVVAAYNVYFDIRFLEYELSRAGFKNIPPHLCLMYLRPMLGLGRRCSLTEACRAHGLQYAHAHSAKADATAATRLMKIYQNTIAERGIRTFADLAQLKSYKFVNSFRWLPLEPTRAGDERPAPFKSRSVESAPPGPKRHEESAPESKEEESLRDRLHEYWGALKTVLADLQVTDDEVKYLEETKEKLGLRDEQTRVLHARAFVGVVSQFTADQWLDEKECTTLRKLRRCLSRAGWAPGD